jgi:hypothetical protein
MAKKAASKYNAAAAYATMAGGDGSAMGGAPMGDPNGSGGSSTAPAAPDGDADDTQEGGGEAGLSLTSNQVEQMEQLKQSGDMASLGQFIAQLLP